DPEPVNGVALAQADSSIRARNPCGPEVRETSKRLKVQAWMKWVFQEQQKRFTRQPTDVLRQGAIQLPEFFSRLGFHSRLGSSIPNSPAAIFLLTSSNFAFSFGRYLGSPNCRSHSASSALSARYLA